MVFREKKSFEGYYTDTETASSVFHNSVLELMIHLTDVGED